MSKNSSSQTPRLRFAEFSGDWIERKAGKYFASSRKKGSEGLPIYSVTQNDGLVRRDSLDRQIGVDAGFAQNLRAEKDDLVYNMMRMWQGAVGKATEPCMVSPAYVVLSPRKTANSQFFLYMFNRKRSLYWLWAYSYGLTNDRLRLYYKDFAQIPFFSPEVDEQEKIASFLSIVDSKIRLIELNRNYLMQYKRSISHQIFSQKICFKDESRGKFPAWTEKRLGEFCTVVSGLTYSPSDIRSDGLLVLRSCNVKDGLLAYSDNVYVDTPVDPQSLVVHNDILVCVRNGSRQLIGKTALVPKDVPVATPGAFMTVLRGSENPFVFQLLQSDTYKRQVHVNLGATINSINSAALKKFRFRIPSSLEERNKIAEFLFAVDGRIADASKTLDAMKQFRAALLEAMFV